MAEPVRNDEPLSSMRSPESPARPGPIPIREAGGDPAALLPERATDKPLGEWPIADDTEGEPLRVRHEEGPSALETLRARLEPVVDFLQDAAADLQHRVRVVRRRYQSGELQEEMRERASDFADEAETRARVARNRAEFYARTNPLRLIAGAAMAGFALGFVLRLWRNE